MANAVEFVLSLKDKITGPSRAAKASLDSVKTSLRGVKSASDATKGATDAVTKSTGGFKGAISRLKEAIDPMKRDDMGRFVKKSRLSLGGFIGTVQEAGSSVVPVLGAIAVGLAAVGGAGIGLVAAGAKYAADMSGFKENTLFAYKHILGGSDKAAMMFKEADDLARAMGGHTTKTAESMRELMGGGFSQTQSKDITAAIADVGALSPTANTDAISAQLAQMKGAGRVLAEDLKPLLNAGLNDDIFYQVLREMTGKSDQKDLKKLLETGKVDADTGIQAILETVNRMGGNKGLGSIAAARANETMAGQVGAAKAMFERLFMSISSGPAGAAMGQLAQQVSGFLDPQGDSGKRILSVLNAMAAAVSGVLASIQGGALGGFLSGLLSYFEALRPIAAGFFGAFGKGVLEAVAAVRVIMAALPGASGMTLDLVGVAKALGSAFAWVAVAIAAVVGVLAGISAVVGLVVVGIGTAIVDLVGWLAEGTATLVSWASQGISIAADFIAGLVAGILSGVVSVADAMREMATGAIDTVKGVFKIQSPSRVMMEVGGYVSEGFTRGVDDGAPAASAAVAGIVAPSALGGIGGAAGGGAGFNVGGITVNINGSVGDAAEDVAAAVREEVEEAMRVIFQRWSGELGAAPAGA